ncbi:hypothetical protein [Hydrogenophaga sp. SL48]|uniref:hypothetical protein n=1 Tax=Hydrogenophaga sp. SL48 TaxID=2806347 RepID=UPI001F207DD4|nr:hypothetical protein [Hydrogenophaga sp. SL48]UJW79456.1 hypothetical protein IM738_16365 [Hydrogenophaga sp. SL48]
MKIVSVGERLKAAGLDAPQLNALQADDTLYTLIAHQPLGRIRITADSIGNADQAEAKRQADALLSLASKPGDQPDLLVCPEYSLPWDSLLEAVEQGHIPESGKLWVLGCESLLLGGLDLVRERLGDRAVVLDDDVFPFARTTQKYRNPLVYVFIAKVSGGYSERLVLLVQYKTAPSGDPNNTEASGMLQGVNVYAFGSLPAEVRLITLVCSDVFGFEKALIDQYYEGLLLLHIQLNNSPRHLLYKKYRQELFSAAGNTELLCLNWADKVVSFGDTGEHPWNNICGSAWYLLSTETNLSDEWIRENHKNGVYYTRHEPIRAHALQFHYRPRVFLFQATKVFHHAIPKPRSTRSGPHAVKTFLWEKDLGSWVEPNKPEEFPDDGFGEQLMGACTEEINLDDIRHLYQKGPVAVERALAITAGRFGVRPDWYIPSRIDSMQLCEHELVRRVTVTQDPAPEARHFRSARLATVRAIAELRSSSYAWPTPVEFLRQGFNLDWNLQYPNRNVVALDGTLATVVHAGLVGDLRELDLLDQQVRKTLAGPPREPDRVLTNEQHERFAHEHYATNAERYCILYAAAAGTKHFLSARSTSFTRPAGQPDVDIGTPSFNRLAANPQGAQG